jgi:hypothetical protein
MRFKLSYKNMQDWGAKVSDSLDCMQEARENFKVETMQMIDEIR